MLDNPEVILRWGSLQRVDSTQDEAYLIQARLLKKQQQQRRVA